MKCALLVLTYDEGSAAAAKSLPGKGPAVLTSEWVDRLAAWRRWPALEEGVCF